LDREIKMPRNS